MTRRELIEFCLGFSDAYEDYPFDEDTASPQAWTAIRHRSNKKVFALIYERSGLCINLKCDPMMADLLRRAFEGVAPAYHMNKVHWNTVRPDSDVPQDKLFDMILDSYMLTQNEGRQAGRKQSAQPCGPKNQNN